MSSSFRYGFWSTSFVCLCTDTTLVSFLVYGFQLYFIVCVRILVCFDRIIVYLFQLNSIVLKVLWSFLYSIDCTFWFPLSLLKLWNCILWNVLRKCAFWSFWADLKYVKTILWKNVLRKELSGLYYVEITNLWKDCGLKILFYLKFHGTLV